jgi:deoxyadenosine/deoxycytidine kinase
MTYFVCVAGSIGSGKTTITDILASWFKLRKFEEEVEDNPYLEKFYGDPKKWSFDLQRFFLLSRGVMHEKSAAGLESCILDRTIYEDREIFARHQINQGLWTPDQIDDYETMYRKITKNLGHPTLLIYLSADIEILRERIRGRARTYEHDLTLPEDPLLPALQELYVDWFKRYDKSPKIRINTNRRDFVNTPKDAFYLIQKVKDHLDGLPST